MAQLKLGMCCSKCCIYSLSMRACPYYVPLRLVQVIYYRKSASFQKVCCLHNIAVRHPASVFKIIICFHFGDIINKKQYWTSSCYKKCTYNQNLIMKSTKRRRFFAKIHFGITAKWRNKTYWHKPASISPGWFSSEAFHVLHYIKSIYNIWGGGGGTSFAVNHYRDSACV